MVIAAKSLSQVVLHMVVAFAVMYGVTGSLAFGGLAALIEPVATSCCSRCTSGFGCICAAVGRRAASAS